MQTYVDSDAFRHVARCDCGWDGRRRWSRASAEVDAAIHGIAHAHLEAAPRQLQLVPLMAS